MLEETGARLQESLRTTPWQEQALQVPYPLRGIITSVQYKDTGSFKQTTANIRLLGGYSNALENVPFCSAKYNGQNEGTGEEWTPEPGDNVVVQFLNGRWNDPIITGMLPNPESPIQATSSDAPIGQRRYHRKCNKTDLVIDKDGNRIEYVAKNETVVIQGHETLTVQTGDITVNVVAGKCTVYVKGKTTWKSDGTIDHDGGSSDMSGIVNRDCICAFTGLPHIDYSANVRASKG